VNYERLFPKELLFLGNPATSPGGSIKERKKCDGSERRGAEGSK